MQFSFRELFRSTLRKEFSIIHKVGSVGFLYCLNLKIIKKENSWSERSPVRLPPMPSEVCGRDRLGSHAGRQEVSRCSTRGESQETCNITRTPPPRANKAEPTLALKSRGDITRSPKQGYQWPHKKDSCPPKNFKKKKKENSSQFELQLP